MAKVDCTAQTVAMLCEHVGVRDIEIELIRLYASKTQDAARWRSFFGSVDIDAERFVFNYMLARLGDRFRWNLVPDSLKPRLQGVRKNFQVKNVTLVARALKHMRVIQDLGIPLLVMRGGALRMGLLPDVPQKMTDIDVVIPKDRFDECWRSLTARGFDIQGYWGHSFDIEYNGDHCIDLHWCMFKNNVHDDERTDLIIQRGSSITSHGVTFSIPSPEDAFLNIMANAAGNFILCQNGKGPITWLADCIDLSERYGLSYPLIAEHSREYGCSEELKVGLALAEHFLPGSFSELQALAGGAIGTRTYRRLKAGARRFLVTDEEYANYSAPRHLVHAFRLIYHENACSYHLEDATPQVLTSYAGLLRDRLKHHDHIDHIWQIPSLVLRRSKVWEERKQEGNDNAQIQ